MDSEIDAAKILLGAYAQFAIRLLPANLLTGDITNREGEITLIGKKSDDLNGGIRKRLLADINRFFWENPSDADDTRLIFKAEEASSKYSEKKDGTAKLVLKIRVDLAANRPEEFCC